MVNLHPNDICDYLAARADADYKSVKFKECLFNSPTDELISTFLYEESVKNKITGMKARLEQEFKAAVGLPELKYLFLYKQCYMDAGRLEILITEFLRKNFSFLTLDLEDNDLSVAKDGFGFTATLRLPKQTSDYIKGSKAFKQFVDELAENNFALFNFIFEVKPISEQKELSLEDIEKLTESRISANIIDKVDKTSKINDRQYLLGVPVKERPVKPEFLRVGPGEQTTAGAISFFTRREFNKKTKFLNEKGEEIVTEKPMPFWTFVIDDGGKKQSCVYFPSGRTDAAIQKNVEKMQTLSDGSTICIVGINEERNGRVNFNVRGISTCRLG